MYSQVPFIPYLQTPSPTSIYVCWHDTSSTGTGVEFGATSALGTTVNGTSEIIGSSKRWHTVLLTGLTPNTEYFYCAKSGTNTSDTLKFRTQPGTGYKGKLRFLLFSDTHRYDTSKCMNVMRAAKSKIEELYGQDMQNQINAVLHSGDLVVFGDNIDEYGKLFFGPLSVFSSSIPVLTVPGNHDRPYNGRDGDAGQNYYDYMKYDSISLIQPPYPTSEQYWSLQFGNTLVIGLNSVAASSIGLVQLTLLENTLIEAQADSTIDFVMCLFHHMPYGELWGEGITYDPGPNYVSTQLIPLFQKYSKVVQLTYGHTHGFERGTIESSTMEGDFRIVCNGGGGGAPDIWGDYINEDYPNIHVTYDHNFYQIVEIDAANKTFTGSMYSIGNDSKLFTNEMLDKWYRKINQLPPATPSVSTPTVLASKIIFDSSPLSGSDSLMTVRIQISYDTLFNNLVVDEMKHWKDVYGVDAQFNPIDRNLGLDLTKLEYPKSRFAAGKSIYYRVRYRDHNLRWSQWSARSAEIVTGVNSDVSLSATYNIEQNYPNPFNPTTRINFSLHKDGWVTLRVYNVLGQETATIVNEYLTAGTHTASVNATALPSGIYFYKIDSGNFSAIKKMMVLK